MTFNADLHVHSRFSRATSRDMDLEHLYIAAQIKGISLVGTGDFTHPQWFAELKDKLVMGDRGLFHLRPDIATACDEKVPAACRRPVRFVLQTEISNIYKKNERTRKNHNLVYFPNFEVAETFNRCLDRLGNIHSDGRPILGLDARDLLEIVLETSDCGVLIPAHVWTPWFSLLGSKSGFDSIDACFGDLSSHIDAVETGLSSDPPMNWRVSSLDGVTLVSNSDAHSPWKLGREATVFNSDLSYDGVFDAIRTGDPKQFGGTIEFYPEEGKYHLDGHRKCQVRMNPRESLSLNNRCPVCGKELTLGVYHRVMALSDRSAAERPPKTHPFTNMVSLTHILGEIFNVGRGSRKVWRHYENIIEALGSELSVLLELPEESIGRLDIPLLEEAISRVRKGKLHIDGGYDGLFGTLSIFSDDERAHLAGQQRLFPGQALNAPESVAQHHTIDPAMPPSKASNGDPDHENPQHVNEPNSAQRAAITHGNGPMMIVAGPGTGKTFTLTHRVGHLITQMGASPEKILAVTFTRKAGQEMALRLERLLPEGDSVNVPHVSTFHACCHGILSKGNTAPISIIADEDRPAMVTAAIAMETVGASKTPLVGDVLSFIIQAKQRLLGPNDDLSDIISNDAREHAFCLVYRRYQELLDLQHLVDFEDLIRKVVVRLETDASFREDLRNQFSHVLVDEYQDINHGQYRLIRALCPPRSNLCVIGDPDQSIYGFRGSSHLYFQRFTNDYPDAAVVRLTQNYRNTPTILSAAYQVVEKQRPAAPPQRPDAERRRDAPPVTVMAVDTDRSEAVAIGKTIEQLVGGTGYQSVDFGAVDYGDAVSALGFSDVAVLVRTHRQIALIEDVFSTAGIPCRRVSRRRIMDNPNVMRLISLLRLVNGQGGIADLSRVISIIRPGISPATMRTVSAWCFRHGLSVDALRYSVRQYPIDGLSSKRQQRLYDFLGAPCRMRQESSGRSVAEIIEHIVAQSRLKRDFRDNQEAEAALEDLFRIAGEHGSDIAGFITAVMLHTDTDHFSRAAEKVSMMTVHAAKGLEFPVVFFAGCEAGIMPFQPPGGRPMDLDEERRIFFVAATRARQRLILSYAKRRVFHGRRRVCEPSPFLEDIENRLKLAVQWHKTPVPEPAPRQLSLF